MITFVCPTCRVALQHQNAGEKVHRPHCGQRVQVPGSVNRTVLADRLDPPPVIPPSLVQPVPVQLEPSPEPTVRCYDCGQLVPVNLAVRRDVVVSWHNESHRGGYTGSSRLDSGGPVASRSQGGWTSGSASGTTTARVDLCPGCDELRNQEPAYVTGCIVFFLVAATAVIIFCLGWPDESREVMKSIFERFKRE